MTRTFLAIGLVVSLPVLTWQLRARGDAGLDGAAEASSEAGMEAAPKDTGSPKDTGTAKDVATDTASTDGETDSANPPPEGGEFGDVVIADGGEGTDSSVPPTDKPPLATDDGGLGDSASSGGCATASAGRDENLGAGLALVLGIASLGWSRRRRPTRESR